MVDDGVMAHEGLDQYSSAAEPAAPARQTRGVTRIVKAMCCRTTWHSWDGRAWVWSLTASERTDQALSCVSS